MQMKGLRRKDNAMKTNAGTHINIFQQVDLSNLINSAVFTSLT